MLKVKNTLVLGGMITAWPVLCLGITDPNSQFEVPDNGDFFSTLITSIFFIVVLGGIALYLSKKFMPKLRPTSGQDINIRETIHLGPNKTMHLVEVGKKKFLVGSTSENITMLADVTEILDAEAGDEEII
ncbi:MAG: flagellar biosynthetic protein FliO [Phycisphaerae bacterium]|nr:flagellar biosynthetic protein FliO [Phycisphaerae bacterium]